MGKPTVKAWMDRGRWLAECPKCGEPLLVKQDTIVCTRCYPGLLATCEVPKPGHEKKLMALARGDAKGAKGLKFITIADLEERVKNKALAEREGAVYPVTHDQPKKEVERLLRPRKITAMNWYPWLETLEDLERQNKEHGL